MEYRDFFQIEATSVANEFLDKYMPRANGDYVKVYLYLLRNNCTNIDIGTIAGELELTEGDVDRAIRYWEKQGIVSLEGSSSLPSGTGDVSAQAVSAGRSCDEAASDREFSDLLIIVQRYREKILTEREVQIIANLHEGLKLPCEVIDYLVEYCVQSGHNSMRYIEKTGIDWASSGIRDVASAKQRVKEFEGIKKKLETKKTVSQAKRGSERRTNYDRILEEIMQG